MMNSKTLLDMDLHKKKLPDNTSPNSEDHILIIVKEGSRSLAKLKGTTDTYTWIHIEKKPHPDSFIRNYSEFGSI